jgi:chlorobactene glucosyltransferase
VIVPARNEEAVFEASLASILDQEYPDFRVIAVDDQSTDLTPAIMERVAARDSRVVVVLGQERPPGWVGKTSAVHQDLFKSHSDWICFIDADMDLYPRALATAMMVARRESADMLSIMPRIDCRTFWQGTIAVSFLQAPAQFDPIDRVNDPKTSTSIAAGGFILIRRSAYERAGGRTRVRPPRYRR